MTNLKKKLLDRDSWLFHLMLMVLISIGFIALLIFGLDLYTQHGESIVVPDLRGKSLEEARVLLRQADLDYEITTPPTPRQLSRARYATSSLPQGATSRPGVSSSSPSMASPPASRPYRTTRISLPDRS